MPINANPTPYPALRYTDSAKLDAEEEETLEDTICGMCGKPAGTSPNCAWCTIYRQETTI